MLKVYSVYDSKVDAFMNPIFLRSKGEALRVFIETVNTRDHQFSKYPQDFTLFELGTFDEIKAKFVLHSTPVSVGLAMEFIKDDVVPPDNSYRPELVKASGV